MMKLYYSPGACSLADHIALREAGLDFDLVKVDLDTKTTEDGRDYREINPGGSVPALDVDGDLFTENAALLIQIAERSGKLLPADGAGRYRVIEAVAFIASEIHKGYKPLFKDASSERQAEAKDELADKYERLAAMMGRDDFIAARSFSIADCYAFVMMRWAKDKSVAVPEALEAYRDRIAARPHVKAALEAEGSA
ncbi:MAG: glutathione binding-like protein [Pacificimonas sp.]|jgi:glutathione S-transferase|nr:glutathione binding-like protein [Pacificimonas sp.]